MLTGGNYESEEGMLNNDEITPHMILMALNEKRQVNAMDLMTSNQRDIMIKSAEGPLLSQIKSSPHIGLNNAENITNQMARIQSA